MRPCHCTGKRCAKMQITVHNGFFYCISPSLRGMPPENTMQAHVIKWDFSAGKVGVAHNRKLCCSLLCHADNRDFSGDMRFNFLVEMHTSDYRRSVENQSLSTALDCWRR